MHAAAAASASTTALITSGHYLHCPPEPSHDWLSPTLFYVTVLQQVLVLPPWVVLVRESVLIPVAQMKSRTRAREGRLLRSVLLLIRVSQGALRRELTCIA